MTVAELIEKLSKFDPNVKVLVEGVNYEDEGLGHPVIQYYDKEAGSVEFVCILAESPVRD